MKSIRIYIKLAFRNIWRNKRRTLIAAASIGFATFFAIVMVSFQDGVWTNTVKSMINLQSGYVQVLNEEYPDDKTLNNAIPTDVVSDSIKGVESHRMRISTFALASQGELTHGTLILGIQMEEEKGFINDRLTEGELPESGEKSVAIGEGLAEYLDLKVGDTLVIVGQGYHGTNAVAALPIDGMMKFPVPEMNKQLVYLPFSTAQYIFRMDGLATEIILDPIDKDNLIEFQEKISSTIDTSQYVVKSWKELMPELVQAKTADEAGAYIVLLVLYVIIAFGIFGVIFMSVKERAYEFGVLVSIGMKRWQLGILVWIENMITGIIGVMAGALLALPLVLYFYYNPIPLTGDMAEMYESFGIEPELPAVFDPQIFYYQLIIVLLMVSVLAIYPIISILKLHPVKSMRE